MGVVSMRKKLKDGEVVVCRSLNQIVVADNTGRKLIITDAINMNKSDDEIRQQFKCFNVKNKEVK